MNLGLAIFLIIIALLVGAVAGFYGARAYMKNYFKENPPISEDMIVAMMSQMGQKPSKKQANENEMPQTSENNSQSQTMSFIGILLAMFGSLLGFLGIKKHRND